MRILAVGNMYPPHHLGGYELTWRSAVEHLRARGHTVRILTTDYRAPGIQETLTSEDDVHRELRWYYAEDGFPRIGIRSRISLERHNAQVLERHLEDFSPDAINWWAMGGMSLSLIERARRRGLPAVGVVGDDWMVYGPRVDAWSRLVSRRRLAPLAERVTGLPGRVRLGAGSVWLFNSRATRNRALAAAGWLPGARVVHPGVDSGLFRPAPAKPWRWQLLYVGRIDERKGIDTAIRALPLLPADAALEVVGSGDQRYGGRLRVLAAGLGQGSRVKFSTKPRSELPAAYAEADALVFPVRWEEPWGLVPLEAMAVGTPVVATGTGGSGEYLRPGENCLLYHPRDDPGGLADALTRLAGDGPLRKGLREGGLETSSLFTEDAYNRAIAQSLERAAGADPASWPA